MSQSIFSYSVFGWAQPRSGKKRKKKKKKRREKTGISKPLEILLIFQALDNIGNGVPTWNLVKDFCFFIKTCCSIE